MHYSSSGATGCLHAVSGEASSDADMGGKVMLYTIAMILLILWLLGFVSGYAMGAFIHVLLVIALVLLVVQFVSGRRVM
jgi:hypothetical protein